MIQVRPQRSRPSSTTIPSPAKSNGLWFDPIVYISIALILLLLQYAVLSVMTFYPEESTTSYNRNLLQTRSIDQHVYIADDWPVNERSMDFQDGRLNVHPTLHRQCITIRFRGDNNNYTVDDAVSLLTEKYIATPGPRHLRMGIIIMEDVNKFLPVRIRSMGNQYHMFHFMELIVMSYMVFHRFSSTLPIHAGFDPSSNTSNIIPTSLSKGSPSIMVPWIFSPYMSPSELCGGASGINCMIADLILKGSKHSIFSSHAGIIGLDDMEHYPFDYENEKFKAIGHRIQLAQNVYGDSPVFADHADGVILVERFGCHMGGINKPWSAYIDTFPAYSWHSDLLFGLGRTWMFHQKSSPKQFVLGYIDRQNTDRRLPDEHHNWIVQYATTHDSIDFRQLHMEEYSAAEQIEMASECDLLIGMHGNGLTHALWMQPRRYVVEFFWKYNYQFDYATIAHMMKHSYLGILNGKVVDPTRVENRDPLLRKIPSRKEAQHAPVNESMHFFEHEGKVAIQRFIEQAITELDI